jgi:uncharacterized protein (DUF1330 family)
MSGYVFVDIDIVDPVGFDEYRKRVVPMVQKWGGQYLVAGGNVETLEGDWQPKRIVMIEFPSMSRAKEWLNCDEYREAGKIRHRTARTNMVLIEGM